jgi:hypothetical protein
MKTPFYNIPSFVSAAFGSNITLLPSVDELFEIEMAYLEFNCLTKEQLLERSAFIKSIDNQPTKHYLLYSNYNEVINENRTAQMQAYFEEGQFSTGYATHGLFPYRGKFHPQLIKGLLNILGIEKSEMILDPMAGSGTANIEAALIGINSVACDVSPFCQFMIKVKYESLTIDLNLLEITPFNTKKLFDFFKQGNVLKRISEIKNIEKQKIYSLTFLAWLDALGYSKRVVRSNHEQLFEKVLPRYIETVKSTLKNPYFKQNKYFVMIIGSNNQTGGIWLEQTIIDSAKKYNLPLVKSILKLIKGMRNTMKDEYVFEQTIKLIA